MKKDLYAIAYVISALVLAGAVAYYIFFFQKGLFADVNQDADLISVSARQEALAQQITKAAVGMGYSQSERNFQIFQAELARVIPRWEEAHNALINGNAALGIENPPTTSDYNQLQEELRFFYDEININANNLRSISYTTTVSDVNYLALRGSIETLLNTIRKYQVAAQNVTDYFVEQSQITKAGFSLLEYILIGGVLFLLILQGL
ncbi:MAG: type IV pili methyl-accepting chemotaxis transducer N-terminal domain-containing protein, partial [Cyclobacteriaceae bacterium]